MTLLDYFKKSFNGKNKSYEIQMDLVGMLALLSNESKWTQWFFEYDNKYCLYGAFNKLTKSSPLTIPNLAYTIQQNNPDDFVMYKDYKRGDYFRVISRWNDDPKRKYEDVKKLLVDKIIELDKLR